MGGLEGFVSIDTAIWGRNVHLPGSLAQNASTRMNKAKKTGASAVEVMTHTFDQGRRSLFLKLRDTRKLPKARNKVPTPRKSTLASFALADSTCAEATS